MQLISLQKDTVDRILELYNPADKVVCEFKAPTGSGKTLMASYFISKMIEEHQEDNFIFVIATPSSSSLPLFFEQKINKYKVDLPYSKFEIEYIQSPSSKSDKSESIDKIVPQKNKVYIFGKSSFGRGRILSEYKIIDDFVLSAIDKGYKLIYIRDEAHIGGENKDNSQEAVNFEELMNNNASFVLRMTATPNMGDLHTKKVILKESELNNPLLNEGKYLLKTHPIFLLDKDLEDTEILNDAISKFKNIKKEYEELNIGIHPAMLIQVDNSSLKNKEKAQTFEKNLSSIKTELKNAGLKWVQYFGDSDKDSNRVYESNFTLEDITENNNEIDVIIFKIGPATGWDIPRACMLLQLRDVSSVNLNIQTIGRIKRNPYPNLEKNDITDKYYIYSNVEDCDKDTKIYNYELKEEYSKETFLSISISNKKDLTDNRPQPEFTDKLDRYLEENKNFIIQELKYSFEQEKEQVIKYKKVINRVGAKKIYTTISNPFIFLRDYKRKIIANKPIYEKIEGSIEKFAENLNIQKEFIFTILFENKRKNEILDLINQTKEFRPIYKVNEEFYDPKSYIEIYNSEKEDEKISSKKEYLFKINEDREISNRQPLDSKGPEHVVFEKLDEFIIDCENVKLWAKNLTSSNIFGEYLDDVNNIRKSYFDFILKFENGFYLYIEVKGIPDINENKTKLLEKAYKDYFEQNSKDLFSHKLAICVWKVDDQGQIKSSVYYDRNTIKEDLNVLNVENLLNTISNL